MIRLITYQLALAVDQSALTSMRYGGHPSVKTADQIKMRFKYSLAGPTNEPPLPSVAVEEARDDNLIRKVADLIVLRWNYKLTFLVDATPLPAMCFVIRNFYSSQPTKERRNLSITAEE